MKTLIPLACADAVSDTLYIKPRNGSMCTLELHNYLACSHLYVPRHQQHAMRTAGSCQLIGPLR